MNESLKDRRLAFRQFIKLLRKTNDPTPERVVPIERHEDLQALEALKGLQALEVSNKDYREYKYQDGDVVYCDIPYEKDGRGKCNDYGDEFNSLEFYEWAISRPYQVYFSSYEISDKRFYKKKVKTIRRIMGAASNHLTNTEYIYSNRPIE